MNAPAAEVVPAQTPLRGGLAVKTRLMILVVVLSNVTGNLFLSFGMKQGGMAGGSLLEYVLAVFRPWVLAGIVMLTLWMLSRMTLLSWADLSYVLPVTSIGYALSAMAGKLFLGEHISLLRWGAILLIVLGTSLVSATHPDGASAHAMESNR